MTVEILAADFDSPGGFAHPPWAFVSGSGFQSDGTRAYPLTTGGNECEESLQTSFILSTPGPAIEYELDVITPSTASQWPAAGAFWRQGLGFLKGSGRPGMTYTIERATTGPASTAKLTIRGSAAASDSILSTITISALNPNQLYRLKVQVTLNPTVAVMSLYLDGTLIGFANMTLAQFNTVTGNSLLSFPTVNLYPSLWCKIDNAPATADLSRFDRLRVRDLSTSAGQVDSYPAPTLTAEAALTPYTMGVEDNSTGDDFSASGVPNPDWPNVPDDQWKTIETRFDSGHVQSIATQGLRRLRIAWNWGTLTQTERDALVAFHATVQGRTKAFAWTEPTTGASFKCKFVAPVQTPMKSRGGASGGRIFSASTEVEMVPA